MQSHATETNQILWFYSFFRFSIWKNHFQLSALPLFTLLRGPCKGTIFDSIFKKKKAPWHTGIWTCLWRVHRISSLAFMPLLLATLYRISSLCSSHRWTGNYNDRSTAFKNSITFFMASSSEDTVFSHAVRALIPNSFAWKDNFITCYNRQ